MMAVYGETAVGGVIQDYNTYKETMSGVESYIDVVVTGHAYDPYPDGSGQISGFYLNDDYLPWNSTHWDRIDGAPIDSTGGGNGAPRGTYRPKNWGKRFSSGTTNAADAAIRVRWSKGNRVGGPPVSVRVIPEWTSADEGKNILWSEWQFIQRGQVEETQNTNEIFREGFPNVRAVLKYMRCFDPRKSTDNTVFIKQDDKPDTLDPGTGAPGGNWRTTIAAAKTAGTGTEDRVWCSFRYTIGTTTHYMQPFIIGSDAAYTVSGADKHVLTDESTWEWTDNPVLQLIHYQYVFSGRGWDHQTDGFAEHVWWNTAAQAADKCDELVSIPGGQTEKRWRCDVAVLLGNEDGTDRRNEDVIRASCLMEDVITGGKHAYSVPQSRPDAGSDVPRITPDMIVGQVAGASNAPVEDRFNTVQMQFASRDHKYRLVSSPERSNAQDVQKEGTLLETIVSHGITRNTQMQRLGNALLKQQETLHESINLPLNWNGYILSPDGVFDLEAPGVWSTVKRFRVESMSVQHDRERPITVLAIEDESDVYEDLPVSDYHTLAADGTQSFGDAAPFAPKALVATGILDGVSLTWTNPTLYDEIIVYASLTDQWDARLTDPVFAGDANTFTHVTDTRHWYWVRAILNGRESLRTPNDDVSDVSGTPVAAPGANFPEIIYGASDGETLSAGELPLNSWTLNQVTLAGIDRGDVKWSTTLGGAGYGASKQYGFVANRSYPSNASDGDSVTDNWVVNPFAHYGRDGADANIEEVIYGASDGATLSSGEMPLNSWTLNQIMTAPVARGDVTWDTNLSRAGYGSDKPYGFRASRRHPPSASTGDAVTENWAVNPFAHFGIDGEDGEVGQRGPAGQDGRLSDFSYRFNTSAASLPATGNSYRFFTGGTAAANSGTNAGNTWAEIIKADYVEISTLDTRGVPNFVLQDLTTDDYLVFEPKSGQWASFAVTGAAVSITNGYRIPVSFTKNVGSDNVPPPGTVRFVFSRPRRNKPGHSKTYSYNFLRDSVAGEGVSGRYAFHTGSPGTSSNIIAAGSTALASVANATLLVIALRDEDGSAALAFDQIRPNNNEHIIYEIGRQQWIAWEVISRNDLHSAGGAEPWVGFGLRLVGYDLRGGVNISAQNVDALFRVSEYAVNPVSDMDVVMDEIGAVSSMDGSSFTVDAEHSGTALVQWTWESYGAGIASIDWDKTASGTTSTCTVNLATITGEVHPVLIAIARAPSTGDYAYARQQFVYVNTAVFEVDLDASLDQVNISTESRTVVFTASFPANDLIAEIQMQRLVGGTWTDQGTAETNRASPFIYRHTFPIDETPGSTSWRVKYKRKSTDTVFANSDAVTVTIVQDTNVPTSMGLDLSTELVDFSLTPTQSVAITGTWDGIVSNVQLQRRITPAGSGWQNVGSRATVNPWDRSYAFADVIARATSPITTGSGRYQYRIEYRVPRSATLRYSDTDTVVVTRTPRFDVRTTANVNSVDVSSTNQTVQLITTWGSGSIARIQLQQQDPGSSVWTDVGTLAQDQADPYTASYIFRTNAVVGRNLLRVKYKRFALDAFSFGPPVEVNVTRAGENPVTIGFTTTTLALTATDQLLGVFVTWPGREVFLSGALEYQVPGSSDWLAISTGTSSTSSPVIGSISIAPNAAFGVYKFRFRYRRVAFGATGPEFVAEGQVTVTSPTGVPVVRLTPSATSVDATSSSQTVTFTQSPATPAVTLLQRQIPGSNEWVDVGSTLSYEFTTDSWNGINKFRGSYVYRQRTYLTPEVNVTVTASAFAVTLAAVTSDRVRTTNPNRSGSERVTITATWPGTESLESGVFESVGTHLFISQEVPTNNTTSPASAFAPNRNVFSASQIRFRYVRNAGDPDAFSNVVTLPALPEVRLAGSPISLDVSTVSKTFSGLAVWDFGNVAEIQLQRKGPERDSQAPFLDVAGQRLTASTSPHVFSYLFDKDTAWFGNHLFRVRYKPMATDDDVFSTVVGVDITGTNAPLSVRASITPGSLGTIDLSRYTNNSAPIRVLAEPWSTGMPATLKAQVQSPGSSSWVDIRPAQQYSYPGNLWPTVGTFNVGTAGVYKFRISYTNRDGPQVSNEVSVTVTA